MTTPERSTAARHSIYDSARDATKRAKETRETTLKVFKRLQETMDDTVQVGALHSRANAEGQSQ